MMTDLLTVQKMHSFRPVFALPPCALHPGHRSTPVTLHSWIYLALVSCHIPASASKHTKKGGRRPPFSATRYAAAAVYALISASAATTAPAAPASNNPPMLQLCTQRRLYTPKLPRTLWQSQSQHEQTIARCPYFAMSFWMRSMASTVASASPKAVRRT